MRMEKSNAFKNWINTDVIKKLSKVFYLYYSDFDQNKFEQVCLLIPSLELKARSLVISNALFENLPKDYRKSIDILTNVIKSKKLTGFELLPISDYISEYGINHFNVSMNALFYLTQEFTSEFAIRHFFIKDYKKTLTYFHKWSTHPNMHVRRFVSEGSRPLLPWGLKLKMFQDKPELTLKLLRKLKYDEELYVRKSVANHLNDLTKNNPEIIIKELSKWESTCPSKHKKKIEWIKKHALRTLIKKGNTKALKLMGITASNKLKINYLRINKNNFKIDDKIYIECEISSLSKKTEKIILDYVIYFLKSNGKTSPKVFKLKSFSIAPGESVKIKKTHSLKKITTMKFYPGIQLLGLKLNGIESNKIRWKFLI